MKKKLLSQKKKYSPTNEVTHPTETPLYYDMTFLCHPFLYISARITKISLTFYLSNFSPKNTNTTEVKYFAYGMTFLCQQIYIVQSEAVTLESPLTTPSFVFHTVILALYQLKKYH